MHPYIFEVQRTVIPKPVPGKIRKDGNFYLGVSFKSGGLISLNRVAGEIYNLCDGKKSLDDVVEEMKVRYPDVEIEQLRYDVLKCVRNLEFKKLLEVR